MTKKETIDENELRMVLAYKYVVRFIKSSTT